MDCTIGFLSSSWSKNIYHLIWSPDEEILACRRFLSWTLKARFLEPELSLTRWKFVQCHGKHVDFVWEGFLLRLDHPVYIYYRITTFCPLFVIYYFSLLFVAAAWFVVQRWWSFRVIRPTREAHHHRMPRWVHLGCMGFWVSADLIGVSCLSCSRQGSFVHVPCVGAR
jgi:hypothetical protein